jgi:hypothetical protein
VREVKVVRDTAYRVEPAARAGAEVARDCNQSLVLGDRVAQHTRKMVADEGGRRRAALALQELTSESRIICSIAQYNRMCEP